MTGLRYARAVLLRRPKRTVPWLGPAPSWVAPLTSALKGMPISCAASTKVRTSGWGVGTSETRSGPSAP